jgi:hypothetical protein
MPLYLSNEVLSHIIGFLHLKNILSFRLISKRLRGIVDTDPKIQLLVALQSAALEEHCSDTPITPAESLRLLNMRERAWQELRVADEHKIAGPLEVACGFVMRDFLIVATNDKFCSKLDLSSFCKTELAALAQTAAAPWQSLGHSSTHPSPSEVLSVGMSHDQDLVVPVTWFVGLPAIYSILTYKPNLILQGSFCYHIALFQTVNVRDSPCSC